MITQLFFDLAMTIIAGALGLLPAYTLPPSVAAAGNTLGAQMASLNGVFPVTTLGVCLGIILAFYVVTGVVHLVLFVYNLVPFKAT